MRKLIHAGGRFNKTSISPTSHQNKIPHSLIAYSLAIFIRSDLECWAGFLSLVEHRIPRPRRYAWLRSAKAAKGIRADLTFSWPTPKPPSHLIHDRRRYIMEQILTEIYWDCNQLQWRIQAFAQQGAVKYDRQRPKAVNTAGNEPSSQLKTKTTYFYL